jgi:hypothetical protein
MVPFQDWFPLSVVGLTFTTLSVAKFYGLRKGIVGGGGKCARDRFLGVCPTWSRKAQLIAPWISLALGLTQFVILGLKIFS